MNTYLIGYDVLLPGQLKLDLYLIKATSLKISIIHTASKETAWPKDFQVCFSSSDHKHHAWDLSLYTMGLKSNHPWHLLTCYLFLHNFQLAFTCCYSPSLAVVSWPQKPLERLTSKNSCTVTGPSDKSESRL